MIAMTVPAGQAVEAAPLIDAASVRDCVQTYARKIGCDDSNTRAAIAWAMRYGTHTMSAIRAGRERADALRDRQPVDQPPPVAA